MDIYKAQNIHTKEICIAKILRRDLQDKLSKREIRNLISCQHPTVVKFIGFSEVDFDGNQKVTVFMHYSEKGSLMKLLQNRIRGLLPSDFDNTKLQIILVINLFYS